MQPTKSEDSSLRRIPVGEDLRGHVAQDLKRKCVQRFVFLRLVRFEDLFEGGDIDDVFAGWLVVCAGEFDAVAEETAG